MPGLVGAACELGSHRVIDPVGNLPQSAWRLDNTPVPHDNEVLCNVETLNIDSASFRQIAEAVDHDAGAIAAHILETVRTRGKQHNAVTGSGGMFVGTIEAVGTALSADVPAPGTRIASLVSLTLTPLFLEAVEHVDVRTGHVHVRGKAILFERSLFAVLPDDLPVDVALAALDVAGAPAQAARLCKPGMDVVVIGADGKSGMLACAQAKEHVGENGRVIGIAPSVDSPGALALCEAGLVDEFIAADARNALEMRDLVRDCIPSLADLVINCVNVPGTELGSILATRDGGTIYFFSMNTSFTAAALGAEGAGKDVAMMIGNGYAAGHADLALQTLRDHPALRAYFTTTFGTER